jgi:hypothetical protein
VTLLGAYASGSRSGYGLRVRRFAGVNFYNGILQGWHSAGVSLSTDFGPVSVDRCAWYGNVAQCTSSSSPETCTGLFQPPLENIIATASTVVDASNIEDPDLRGVASQLPEPLDPSAIDPWFEPVTYVGGVPPEGQGEDWTHESWISWQAH